MPLLFFFAVIVSIIAVAIGLRDKSKRSLSNKRSELRRTPRPHSTSDSGRLPQQPPTAAPEALPYRPATALLSKGERAVWYPLFAAVKGRYRLFCKVRLADVVCCPRTHPNERHWFRKIGRYHVDFVVCDPESTQPLLVVELDDRGHRRFTNQQRDLFKDDVLRSAGVPVLRIQAQQAYAPDDLAAKIDRLIQRTGSAAKSA